MNINLPNPYVGGDLSDPLPDDDPAKLVKVLKERFDQFQANFDMLAKKVVTGPQDLPKPDILYAVVGATSSTASTTPQTVNTPSLTLPAGVWDIEWGADYIVNMTAVVNDMRIDLFLAGSSTGTALHHASGQWDGGTVYGTRRRTVAAGTVINPRYYTNHAVATNVSNIFVRATPVKG